MGVSCPHCRDRVEELEEEVRQLRASAVGPELSFPRPWRLTPTETVLMGLLLHRDVVRFEDFVTAIRSKRWDYDPEPVILSVFVLKLRRKLARFGVEITNHWSEGYGIERPLRDAVYAAMATGEHVIGPAVSGRPNRSAA